MSRSREAWQRRYRMSTCSRPPTISRASQLSSHIWSIRATRIVETMAQLIRVEEPFALARRQGLDSKR
jgi:hypothetical protein